jgi:hypothetical protein
LLNPICESAVPSVDRDSPAVAPDCFSLLAQPMEATIAIATKYVKRTTVSYTSAL